MPFSRQTTRAFPSLPSIYTSFPLRFSPTFSPLFSSTFSSTTTSSSASSDELSSSGLELVPLERSNTSNNKILSPVTDEKEVVVAVLLHERRTTKPLPQLPRCKRWSAAWERLGVKQRIGVLFAVQVCLALVILGGLISVRGSGGGERNKGNTQSNNPDGTPPRNVPSMPIQQGNFTLTLQGTPERSSTCLSRMNESESWACSSDQKLNLTITSPTNSSANNTISITPSDNMLSIVPGLGFLNSDSNLVLRYGRYGQLPISLPPTTLTPSRDPELPQYRLAYYFKTRYNRTVLVRSTASTQDLVSTNSNNTPERKTGDGSGGGRMISGAGADQFLQEDDEPWLCHFNENIVEGYIYVPLPPSNGANSTAASNTTATPRQDDDEDTPALPYSFKLIETRYPGSPAPYCEKVLVSKDGLLLPMRQAPSIVLLTSDAKKKEDSRAARPRRRTTAMRLKRQDVEKDTCKCMWTVA